MIADWISWLPSLLAGLQLSVIIAIAAIVIGLVLGLLLSLLSINHIRLLSWGAIGLVELLRGVPLLVFLYLVYYGLPSTGVTLDSMTAAIAAIGINAGAYFAEIFRAGLLSVPTGQREAARSLGIGRLGTLRVIVLPQALRTVFPAIVSYSIIVFQATSLCYLIGIQETLGRGFLIGSLTFKYLSVLTLVGILYAVISIAGSRFAHRLAGRRPAQHTPVRL